MHRFGNAYFLLINTRKNTEFEPEYGISAILNNAAAEWFPGIDTYEK
jgi:hypothetical protein